MQPPPTGWPVYSIYGIAVTSDFPFSVSLPPASAPPVLRIAGIETPPQAMDWPRLEPVARSPYCTPAGEPRLTCYELADCEVLRLARIADFYLYPDRILYHILDPHEMVDIETLLLGAVPTRWQERRGAAMLHASAVVTAAGAIAFLAMSHGGKSTLAASFVAAGCPLLTDDILPVQLSGERALGAPGYPQMRLWPEAAGHFLGKFEHLPPVYPNGIKRRVPVAEAGLGAFCLEPQPLAAFYLPQRHNAQGAADAIAITPLGPAEALFNLVGYSFASLAINNITHQQQRVALLRDVAQRVPVRRLRYPSGYAYLPAVRRAILQDLE